ncbi:hypothetical protein CK216_23575 [Mesorhizobium sp. WSM3876]|nr:hypothetical protein CK216_23575 [Mesorhizobium sp. WSM3876]
MESFRRAMLLPVGQALRRNHLSGRFETGKHLLLPLAYAAMAVTGTLPVDLLSYQRRSSGACEPTLPAAADQAADPVRPQVADTGRRAAGAG